MYSPPNQFFNHLLLTTRQPPSPKILNNKQSTKHHLSITKTTATESPTSVANFPSLDPTPSSSDSNEKIKE